jgi:hypothetical protein
LYQAVAQDAAAYSQVMEAFKLPKDTPEQQQARLAAVEQATLGAIQVPLETAQYAVQALKLAQTVVSLGNLNAISDGASAAALAVRPLRRGLNVRQRRHNPWSPGKPWAHCRLGSRAAQLERLQRTVQGRGLAGMNSKPPAAGNWDISSLQQFAGGSPAGCQRPAPG